MLKKLYVKLCKRTPEHVHLVITEQSHRGSLFGDRSNCFIGSHMRLCSDTCPAVSFYVDRIYVRGHNPDKDFKELKVRMDRIERVLQVIREYNQHFNNNKLVLSDVVENLELLEGDIQSV